MKMKKSNNIMEDKKRRNRFLIIGIALLIVFCFSFLAVRVYSQSSEDLKSELNSLESELNNQGYSWLINQTSYLNINDNLMLSNDNKILTL